MKKILITILVAVFFILLVPRIFDVVRRYYIRLTPIERCENRLLTFKNAVKEFTDPNSGELLLRADWCDVFKKADFPDQWFICPGKNKPPCDYALNKSVLGLKISELDSNIVLIFDSKTGWNLVGGPELLAPENHEGKGCNILFADGRVEFVKKEKFDNLKWKH